METPPRSSHSRLRQPPSPKTTRHFDSRVACSDLAKFTVQPQFDKSPSPGIKSPSNVDSPTTNPLLCRCPESTHKESRPMTCQRLSARSFAARLFIFLSAIAGFGISTHAQTLDHF